MIMQIDKAGQSNAASEFNRLRIFWGGSCDRRNALVFNDKRNIAHGYVTTRNRKNRPSGFNDKGGHRSLRLGALKNGSMTAAQARASGHWSRMGEPTLRFQLLEFIVMSVL